MIFSNSSNFFRGGPKFNQLLQMGFGTVAIDPPREILFVGNLQMDFLGKEMVSYLKRKTRIL